jgi:hypothetical protein
MFGATFNAGHYNNTQAIMCSTLFGIWASEVLSVCMICDDLLAMIRQVYVQCPPGRIDDDFTVSG